MAPKINPDSFRRKKAASLRKMGEILCKYPNLCYTTGAFSAAAEECTRNRPNGPNSWGYNLSGLLFTIKKPRHTIPKNASNTLNLMVNIEVKGFCVDASDDPFEHLAMDIEVSTSPTKNRSICAWHLDRHVFKKGDNDPDDVHPLYHFHYGGNRMDQIKENIGQILLLDSPRIHHPPLDGILAVDFVLSNFAGSVWRELSSDGTYRNLVIESQQQLWKPYFESILVGWKSKPERKGFNTHSIIPTLAMT